MKFTIFTPVYNGEKTFVRVYESLKAQTYKDFEWIIVNDGSSDNSDKVIKKYISEQPNWNIIYLTQKNSGKHVAWNRGIEYASGDLFLSADCDDSFIPETLAFFNDIWNSIKDTSKVSGINVSCIDNIYKKITGTPYPKDGMITDNIELVYSYNIKGEHWGCVRTDLLKSIKFPIIEGHHFSENYLWFSLALNGYKVYCFNKVLRTYFIEQTSLTHDKKLRVSRSRLKMEYIYNQWKIKKMSKYFIKNIPTALPRLYKDFFKSLIRYYLYS